MAADTKQRDPRTVKLKGVRLSFADSLKDKKKTAKTEDAKLAHCANLILESTSPNFADNKSKCLAAVQAACEQEWKNKDKWKELQEENPKAGVAYRKGERFKNQETGEVYSGYAGNMVIAGKGPSAGQKRPRLLDRGKRRLKDQAKPEDLKAGIYFEESAINDIFYGGCYCDAIVSFYGTKKGGDKVCVSIDAIHSHQNGERVGGGVEVDDDDFDDFDDEEDLGGGAAASSDDDDIG